MYRPLILTRCIGLAVLLACALTASAFSQTLASIQQRPDAPAPKIVQLKSALLEIQHHYKVEIVFEDR
ncbi:MAG: hypothetical protein KKG00_04825, partial [Bacteroidetes bacterium]|nr:hypothetical protein [Bacteroidota bacterium]